MAPPPVPRRHLLDGRNDSDPHARRWDGARADASRRSQGSDPRDGAGLARSILVQDQGLPRSRGPDAPQGGLTRDPVHGRSNLRTMVSRALLALLLLAGVAPAAAQTAATPPKLATATRVPTRSIRMDGRLDEAEWQRATPLTD